MALNTKAIRLIPGSISLSVSSHLPIIGNSNGVKPVMFPPGRAKLVTKPIPTGSITKQKTIGTVRVASFNAATTGALLAPQ